MRVVNTAGRSGRRARTGAARSRRPRSAAPDVFLEKFIPRPRHIEVQLLGDTARQPGAPVRARLLGAAAASESGRDRAGRRTSIPTLRSEICDAALAHRPGRRLRERRHGRVPGRRRHGQVLLHRGQSAHPGRAHRHRGSDRRRHRQVPDPGRRRARRCPTRRSASASQDERQHQRLRHPVPRDDRGPGEQLHARLRPRIAHYRSAGGMGIRLDAGTAFSGAVVTPFYDSLLVKVTACGPRFVDAARRMERCLQEFRIRGVKTNIPFLINLVTHPKFLAGGFTTRFIDETPELFHFAPRQDRATQAADLPRRRDRQRPSAGRRERRRSVAPRAGAACRGSIAHGPMPDGTRQKLLRAGAGEVLPSGCCEQKQLLLTDTTFRDAHQSLLATRMRTLRHAGDRRGLRAARARNCSRSRCGAGRRSTRRCGF